MNIYICLGLLICVIYSYREIEILAVYENIDDFFLGAYFTHFESF